MDIDLEFPRLAKAALSTLSSTVIKEREGERERAALLATLPVRILLENLRSSAGVKL